MSVLSDGTIAEGVGRFSLVLAFERSGLDSRQIQPASMDLTLGTFLQRRAPWQRGWHEWAVSPGSEIKLWPKEFLLAHTEEYVNLPSNIGAFCAGKSSIGRGGLMIENAGWIDPGFAGQLTLELYNQTWHRLTISPGMRICQIIFLTTDQPVLRPYEAKGRYQFQTGATPARPERVHA